MATQILEINLISAQGLKSPFSKSRRLQTYALIWIDSSTKLRTRVDRAGAESPIWNEKFLFKVTPEFLSSQTAAICVEIHTSGYLRDYLIGTVRCLVSNISLSEATKTPSFTAFQVRRPSGKFRGVLSVGSMIIDGSDLPAFDKVSAIGYRDLMGMGESQRVGQRKERLIRKSKSMADELDVGEDDDSWENSSCAGSLCSDGADSSTSSSSTTSTVLKEWNGITCMSRINRLRSASESMLCGLLIERKRRSNSSSSPSNQNVDV